MQITNFERATSIARILKLEFKGEEAEKVVAMQQLADEAVAWATAHGLQMMDAKHPTLCKAAPFSLLPTPLSREAFELGVSLAPAYNELVDKVSRDLDWVYKVLEGVLEHDEFTARLVKICRAVEEQGVVQRTYLGINRSDYMFNKGEELLQVELNTIASSFGCLSARVARLHRFLLDRFPDNEVVKSWCKDPLDINMTPENLADKKLPHALARAAYLHLDQREEERPEAPPTVLFVVQDGERNSFDQRWLEYELWDKHKVACMRRSLGQLHDLAKVSEDGRDLVVDGKLISVIYFRSGYTPDDYPEEKQWDARMLLETTNAIKCPSIQYQLVGTKKVQQELAGPGQIERFMGEEQGAKLRKSFAGLWSLDVNEQDEEAKAAVKDAILHPENYVVKPQREGGGNNIYGDKVKTTLETMPKSEQAAYILMQRIFPNEVDAVLVRGLDAEVVSAKALQELGVYGVFIGNGETEFLNEYAGQLLRTKLVGVDEGGVATGFSCLDSPQLVSSSD